MIFRDGVKKEDIATLVPRWSGVWYRDVDTCVARKINALTVYSKATAKTGCKRDTLVKEIRRSA